MSGSFPSRYEYNRLTGQFIPIYDGGFAPVFGSPEITPRQSFGLLYDGGNGFSDVGGPTGAPSTGSFGRDISSFTEATGPMAAGLALGAVTGGIPGAVMGGMAGNMAQGLAQALGLSAAPTGPVSGLTGVIGNVAQTQMGMQPTSSLAQAIADMLGFNAPPSALHGPVTVENMPEPTTEAEDSAMSMAETQDQTGVSVGEASQADSSTGDNNGPGDSTGPGGPGDNSGDSYRFGGLVSGKQNAPKKAVVHGGEYVLRAEAVKKYGLGLLDALNESRVPKKRVSGLLG